MRFLSTRGESHRATLSEAIQRGLAPDGGLYVPEDFPELSLSDFGFAEGPREIGEVALLPFFEDDPLDEHLSPICAYAFEPPIPLLPLDATTSVLELFRGPTAAFKDFGARFLAGALSALRGGNGKPLTVLVATSGDTGGAVAAAFHDRPGVRVLILFPNDRISKRQEKQLTTWGGNVRALAVRGDFDDCQRLVKEAFSDEPLRRAHRLTSANSINLGRLLPQMAYYAYASVQYLRENGAAPGFIIPSGNLGNAAACLWARALGCPVREVVLSTNANPTITHFTATGEWDPKPTVRTVANAMDVGTPSNIERLVHLTGGWVQLRRRIRAVRADDDEIREQIRLGKERWDYLLDPHTATAAAARSQLGGDHWVLVGTAHPAKFEEVVEPIVGQPLELPESLARILELPGEATEIEPTLEALRAELGG